MKENKYMYWHIILFVYIDVFLFIDYNSYNCICKNTVEIGVPLLTECKNEDERKERRQIYVIFNNSRNWHLVLIREAEKNN